MALRQYASTDDFIQFNDGVMPDGMTEDELNRLLQLATLKIDNLTFGRIEDLSILSDFQSEHVVMAVLYQTMYDINHGLIDSFEGDIASYTSLDISVSYLPRSALLLALREQGISVEAYQFLEPTGLMVRRI